MQITVHKARTVRTNHTKQPTKQTEFRKKVIKVKKADSTSMPIKYHILKIFIENMKLR